MKKYYLVYCRRLETLQYESKNNHKARETLTATEKGTKSEKCRHFKPRAAQGMDRVGRVDRGGEKSRKSSLFFDFLHVFYQKLT